MNTSEWSYLLESFGAEAHAGGFSPEEGSRLLMWWLHAPRDEAWVSVEMPLFANCCEVGDEEIP